MAPLVVEGDTLGEKHRNYNKIVYETTQELISEINYDEPDLDNLLKIDIACKNRNVDYIIKVLQCEDMLYVSRAIKQSTWLITDPQYANIVNPNYVNDQLSPNMLSKAFNKFILHIRLNLKDENRVEEFFNYYEERDLQASFKWLPNCSLQLIEKIIQKHVDEFPIRILKRLCKKSFNCLEIYIKNASTFYREYAIMETTFLLKSNMEKYLDIIESHRTYELFGPKATKLIMKKYGERVMKNLEKYSKNVNISTFAKFIRREEIKDFIISNINNNKLHCMFSYGKIKHFVNRLPVESRFEFVKEVFIDKKQVDIDENIVFFYVSNARRNIRRNQSDSLNIYPWYMFAPFNTAFVDLKKLIRLESNPMERTSMLEVMLKCAKKDTKSIHTLLKYYRENHINEPFIFKIQFVNLVIGYSNTHNFDKETWEYLKDLFSSMDVYSESDKIVQNCVRSIILYSIIHDESIPDVIEKKFHFNTFKSNQRNFSEEEKEKVFLYLYNYLLSKLDGLKIDTKKEFSKIIEVLQNMLNLLVDWNKELQDFPIISDKIKETIQISRKNKWNENISVFYNTKMSWRKLLFSESIFLNATQNTCIHALKHSPELLEIYKKEVESFCLNGKTKINQFLKKVRIYWPQSLANNYKDMFMNRIHQKNSHRAAVVGLCILLPKSDLANLLQKYVPNEIKIDWTKPDDVELNCRKHIASKMHLARPQPSLAAVLLYAKGDYLQFALPSLNAILYNMNRVQTRENLWQLLHSPVSSQKHGIRIVCKKLNYDELQKLFLDIWKTTKNSSIQATIFNKSFEFLCKENDPSAIKEMWELLNTFIGDLTSKNNKSIYTNLSKAENVPMSVRPEFWMKSYNFLKTLPAKAKRDALLSHLRNKMDEVMEFLDDDFVAEIFLESFDENFCTKRYEFQYLVVEFVLCTRSKEAHIARYNKILVPILERSFEMWNKSHKGTNYVRENFKNILTLLDSLFDAVVLQRKMILPIPMFTDVLKRVRENLPIDEYYILITTRKLSLNCVKILDKVLKTNEELLPKLLDCTKDDNSNIRETLHAETAAELGKLCMHYLKEDVSNYLPSIYIFFAKAFKNIFKEFKFNSMNKMNALKPFLEFEDFVPGYMFVLKSVPSCVYNDEEKALKSELLNIISAHSSNEIRMHFYDKKGL